jgi:hypothetical protein
LNLALFSIVFDERLTSDILVQWDYWNRI